MKIAFVSTYGPRACGIATFNKNLFDAVGIQESSSNENFVIALNDSESLTQYDYPKEVKYIIRQDNQKDYIRAADFVNSSTVEACILQHEYGIYGGESGVYVLPFIARLNKPLIVVLHTVLEQPDFMQMTILREISKYASKIVVMSYKAVGFLTNIYNIPAGKIELIEHGVPDIDPPMVNPIKNSTGFKGRKVLFTFGLIGRSKGLETVINALPAIVEKNPDVMYVVLGSTHPTIIRHSGEEYRDSLKKLAKKLGVENNIRFINNFVTEEEVHQYLTACDIYITPYLNEAQITSGTLSYAVGAGAVVVSTPYWHAQELLAHNRGVLFNFKDSVELSNIINDLFENETKMSQMKANAYEYGLHLRWPRIGEVYMTVLEDIVSKYMSDEDVSHRHIIDPDLMPTFDLAHIKRLTDDTGIVQHAKYGIPNLKEGYCVDDNSRALILSILAYKQNKSKTALELLPIYLSFIQYMQLEDGNFRNFLSFRREYLDEVGSEDAFGRTIWSLGYLINNAPNNSYKEFAKELFYKSVPHFKHLRHLHGIANTMIGLSYFIRSNKDEGVLKTELDHLANVLKEAYEDKKEIGWSWFYNHMTYDNGIFPLALLCHYEVSEDQKSLDIALESLEFLSEKTLSNGYLSPVGNDGWLYKGGAEMAIYDQQAIETMAMVLMYFKAYQITGNTQYFRNMYLCYQWFLGENSLHLPLYDHETKGCGDGLKNNGVNRNQGAESTLAYWISHLVILQAHSTEYRIIQNAENARSKEESLVN